VLLGALHQLRWTGWAGRSIHETRQAARWDFREKRARIPEKPVMNPMKRLMFDRKVHRKARILV